MRDELARVPRLSIRTTNEDGALVQCPQQRTDIDVSQCLSCEHCIGLAARDSYLVCSWDLGQEQRLPKDMVIR